MKRDPRTSAAFDSGMRGKDKPSEGGSKQGPKTKVGNPDGELYSSGMRGQEKPKEAPVEDGAATLATGDAGGAGSSKQAPNSSVGNPKGEDASKAVGAVLGGGEAQAKTSAGYKVGIPGNNLEHAAAGHEPSFEEDDTHLNIRVPKTSFKRRGAQ
jgi:hypothetical protein